MKRFKSFERGQTLVIIALAAVVLFGFAALAIDGSAKLSDRRHAQNAADTAANAAALAKVNALLDSTRSQIPAACPAPATPYSDVCNLMLQAGKDRAASNGYNNDITNNTVEVYSPPISGYYSTVANKDKYVQVIITSRVKTTFGRVLGIANTVNVVQAVALAEPGGKLFSGASIVSLNPNPNCSAGAGSGGGSVDIGGNGTINLTGGGLFVNSNASCGYSQTSCSVSLNISSGGITSAGSPINLNGCSGTGLTTDTTKTQVVIPDEVYFPDRPIECSQTAAAPDNLGANKWRIYPGYYTDFPQATLIPNNKKITLAPGVYCVNEDVHWSGATFQELDGSSGVTIYILSGHHFSISINSPITLTAPSSGDYKGFVLIQEGNHNSIDDCVINGGGYLDITGTIYAPYCSITINGDSTSIATFNAQVVGWDVKLNGNNTINFNYNPDNNAKNKRKIGLMK